MHPPAPVCLDMNDSQGLKKGYDVLKKGYGGTEVMLTATLIKSLKAKNRAGYAAKCNGRP